MSRLLIFGGTGYAGLPIAAEAQRRGHEVTVVARQAPVEALPGVTYRGGSFFDAELRASAIADADDVIISIRSYNPDGPDLPDIIDAVLAEAAPSNARVGVVGGAGSLSSVAGGPSFIEQANIEDPTLPFFAEGIGHARLLEVMRADTSGADWFYLSPPRAFGAHAPTESYGTYQLGDDVMLIDAEGESKISADDYALAILDELETPRHHRKRFTVAH